MGNSLAWCSCYSKNENEGEKTEEKLVKPKNLDTSHIILIQNLLRGYLDRKKAVQFSEIKYKKPSKNIIKKSS